MLPALPVLSTSHMLWALWRGANSQHLPGVLSLFIRLHSIFPERVAAMPPYDFSTDIFSTVYSSPIASVRAKIGRTVLFAIYALNVIGLRWSSHRPPPKYRSPPSVLTKATTSLNKTPFVKDILAMEQFSRFCPTSCFPQEFHCRISADCIDVILNHRLSTITIS